ncbi:MAG: GNAT family N-acetyltransferase [Candidatus Electrothrix sp. YB6]
MENVVRPHSVFSTNPDWQQKINHLCRHHIKADERLDHMLFLRELFFPEDQQTQEAAITRFPTPTLIQLLTACQWLDDWPLIIYCCQEYQNRLKNTLPGKKQQKQAASNLRLLIRAYQQQGLFAEAEQCLRQAAPGHHRALADEYQQLQQRISNLPQGAEALCSDTLLLTPLEPCHERDFFRQYADPEIADLCVLPEFSDKKKENWQQWLLQCRQSGTEHLFAIQHEYWGFLGSISLEILDRVGFFYFWLGPDFQGYGFGPEAVNILLNWADRYPGLRSCYTKICPDNTPSQKAVRKAGFQALPFKVIVPGEEDEYEDEYLYYRGEQKTEEQLLAEINRLFIRIESDQRAVPVASGCD